MTMYLPNPDIRPTGGEVAEFLDVTPDPVPPAQSEGSSHEKLQFLRSLVAENASVSGDVVQLEENLWGIHGVIPVDGDVLMAEFDSYDEATSTLEQLRSKET